jgi:hypothetical protein
LGGSSPGGSFWEAGRKQVPFGRRGGNNAGRLNRRCFHGAPDPLGAGRGQELLHLAALEPGDNIAECEYCGSFFDIPPGWLEGVPHEGTISFFYCREAAVVAKVLEDGAWGKLPMLQDRPKRHELAPLTSRGVPTEPSEAEHAQLHHRFKSGAGRRARKAGAGAGAGAGSPGRAGIAEAPAVDWKWFEKVRLVKFALWQRASTAEEVFEALDADGGGSLSREEVSAGLLAMGILLAPAETRLLLDTIDVDASGEARAATVPQETGTGRIGPVSCSKTCQL